MDMRIEDLLNPFPTKRNFGVCKISKHLKKYEANSGTNGKIISFTKIAKAFLYRFSQTKIASTNMALEDNEEDETSTTYMSQKKDYEYGNEKSFSQTKIAAINMVPEYNEANEISNTDVSQKQSL